MISCEKGWFGHVRASLRWFGSPSGGTVLQDNCVMSHIVAPKGHSLILRKWEFWEMVGGNTLSSHVIKTERSCQRRWSSKIQSKQVFVWAPARPKKHSEKRLNVWLRVQTDLYGNGNCPFLCNRTSKFVFHSAFVFPGAELGRRGWTGRKGNMENHLADGVAVQGGVQRSPAVPCSPQSTALDPSTASALCEKCKPLCQHTEPSVGSWLLLELLLLVV